MSFYREDNGGLTHDQVMNKRNWRQYHECKLCGKWFFMPATQRYCIWCKRLKERSKKKAVQKSIGNFGSVTK